MIFWVILEFLDPSKKYRWVPFRWKRERVLFLLICKSVLWNTFQLLCLFWWVNWKSFGPLGSSFRSFLLVRAVTIIIIIIIFDNEMQMRCFFCNCQREHKLVNFDVSYEIFRLKIKLLEFSTFQYRVRFNGTFAPSVWPCVMLGVKSRPILAKSNHNNLT